MTRHDIATAPARSGDIAAAERRLRRALRGPLHLPGDAGYDVHRRALNPALDPRPALVVVARCPLGGGVGWLARRPAFAADSLLRAEVVAADGRLVVASRDEYVDIFWA